MLAQAGALQPRVFQLTAQPLHRLGVQLVRMRIVQCFYGAALDSYDQDLLDPGFVCYTLVRLLFEMPRDSDLLLSD